MGQATIFNGQKIKTLKDTLTLNGKSDIISSTVDPTASAVDAPLGSLLINQTSGKLYRKLDAGSSVNWEEVGAGVGGINYILNPSAEVNTTGWATYADAAGTAPVDGTGGSPNVTWSRSTTSPLRGVADFNLVKDAANRQGQGVSYDFTIDEADKAKVLSVTFDYEVLSGTYADGDLTVYLIADPTGTPVVIQPAGYTVLSATVGTTMREVATFQTQATGTSYRLCFHVASTSASAYTLAIDNVVVGPQQTVQGAAISDWVSYTPTVSTSSGSVTNATTTTSKWRRVGDSAHVKGSIVFSAASAAFSDVIVTLPSGLTIDTAKLPSTGLERVGTGSVVDAGSNSFGATVLYQSTNQVIIYAQLASGTIVSLSSITNASPFTFGNADYIDFEFTVPISGWSSNTVMSQDTDTRVVAAKYSTSVSQTINNTSPVLVYETKEIDTHNSYNTSTGVYTVPVAGVYRVSAMIYSNAVATSVGFLTAPFLYKNGSFVSFLGGVRAETTAAASKTSAGSTLVSCVAGDQLTIRGYSDSANSTQAGQTTQNHIAIERLSGPATIAASETVALSGYTTASQSIPNGGATVVFGSKNYDTHGILNTSTGVATIPVSGTFLIQTICDFSGSSVVGVRALDIFKGASRIASGIVVSANIGAATTRITASVVTKLVAGDTISNYAYQNSGGALALSSSATENVFTITRLGN